jgi:hypothetical protein
MDLPPLVIANESVSLHELDLAKVTTWANLPEACQSLYHNIAGRGITLKTTKFPDLAKAIHTSVTTSGYWGYKKLQSKCVNPADPLEFVLKYLRVTIGSSKVCLSCPRYMFLFFIWTVDQWLIYHLDRAIPPEFPT